MREVEERGETYTCSSCGYSLKVWPEENCEPLDIKVKCPRCQAFYLHKQALTIREKEVVSMIADGLSVKEIGDKMNISPKTVEDYRKKVYEKLRIRGVAMLTKYALKEGLTSPEIKLWDEFIQRHME